MNKTLGHFINGESISEGRAFGDVYNPSTGELIGKVEMGDENTVEQAVQSAMGAFEEWSKSTLSQRSSLMFSFKAILEENIDSIAELISREHGKTIEDAKGSIRRGLEVVDFACGIPHLLKGEYSEQVGSGIDTFSTKQPIGICAGITPFNFPAMIPLWMFPMAVACGNAFILKPSEKDPSCPYFLAELFEKAGAPKGLVNVVNGDKIVVDKILENRNISAVSFVGSTPIASYVYQKSALHGKRVQALGGAKNHMVVMPDADLAQAADALMGAAYGSAGERCMAISVAVAVGEVGDKLVEILSEKVRSIKIGPYTDDKTEMGPVISKSAKERIEKLIDSGMKEGAKLVVDGRKFSLQGYEEGFFLGGSLFDFVTTDMQIYKEEIFGPVLSIVRSKNYSDALKIVKNNPYGNGCAIFTRDGDTARNFSNQANIGMVGVNIPIPVPVAYHSFGGWKNSIFGGHNTYGMDAVRFYTRTKTITSKWPSGIREGAIFKMPTLG